MFEEKIARITLEILLYLEVYSGTVEEWVLCMDQEMKAEFIQALKGQWIGKLHQPVSNLLWSLQVSGNLIDLHVARDMGTEVHPGR